MSFDVQTLLPSSVVGLVLFGLYYITQQALQWQKDRREGRRERSDEQSSRVSDEATRTAVLLDQIAGMQKSIDWQAARIRTLESDKEQADQRLAQVEARAAKAEQRAAQMEARARTNESEGRALRHEVADLKRELAELRNS